MVQAENHEVLKHYSLLYAAFAGNRRSYVDSDKMFRADIHIIICFIIASFFLLVQCFVCLLLFLFRNNDMVAGLQLTQAVYHFASIYRLIFFNVQGGACQFLIDSDKVDHYI